MKSNILLLITAAIWGSAFVAQRVGMDYIGPFTYSGIRFLIGGLALIPFAIWLRHWQAKKATGISESNSKTEEKGLLKASLICGLVLFGGVTLQQVAMVYTTAGKGGFITSLYIVLVPIMGLAFKQKAGAGIWLGAALALVGLYLLSIKSDFTLSYGDLLMLIGAFFWAAHVLVIGWVAPKYDPIALSILQFLICGVLSMVCALIYETIIWADVMLAMDSILYAALMSTSIAYTLQVVAQQNAKPSHAAIIFSSEAMFAVLAGWLVLSEVLTTRGLWGCTFIMIGMLLSQLLPDLKLKRLTSAS
ncbi:DMT family transporter [Leucothrix arctica]|uniref:EamA family transporter n=1 Tax=Leucothrix arctica TaxID=1481894 RepID=A0A317CHW1_9GAMM|nr:DMT family transporter [Leucothrix arctica]PWQ97959.1 EamA family transporter [Leucothrix arctica]